MSFKQKKNDHSLFVYLLGEGSAKTARSCWDAKEHYLGTPFLPPKIGRIQPSSASSSPSTNTGHCPHAVLISKNKVYTHTHTHLYTNTRSRNVPEKQIPKQLFFVFSPPTDAVGVRARSPVCYIVRVAQRLRLLCAVNPQVGQMKEKRGERRERERGVWKVVKNEWRRYIQKKR